MRSPWFWLCVVALLVPWLLAAGYLVTLPEEVLTTNLLVDDSLYYTVPARNFWLGLGLSFDGLETTNGVQTLWMLVTLAVAGLISDPMTLLRSLVATSALCWLLAACGLYSALRRRSRASATFAAVGFLWAGVHERLAFMGMENGLTALVSVIVLLVGMRVVRTGWSARGCLALGTAIAVFALNRTEGVLLGPIVAVPLLFGWLGARQSLPQRLRLVAVLAVPGVLLVGGVLLATRAIFDVWLPISGTVKAFYEQEWASGTVHDGLLANVLWHLRHATVLALAPLREDLSAMLSSLSWTKVKLWRNLIWATLALTVLRAAWMSWRSRRDSGEGRGPSFWPVFVFFACVHLVLMGVMLPHFTNYGTWYFASEAVAVWCVVGISFSVLRGRWNALPIVLSVLITMAGARGVTNVARDVTTGQLRSGGIWLENHVAAGTVIGTLSSGLAAWYAPSLHVVNLDGLINNHRYFEDFLSKGRVAEYFDDKGIEWFADYSTVIGWRNGVAWCGRVSADRLVPRLYSRMSGDQAYAVWQVLPRGEPFELLSDRVGIVRDRYVELGVAADVYARFPVVRAADLQHELAANDQLVVGRSIVEDPPLALLHVLVTNEQLQQIALTEATVWPIVRVEKVIDGAVRLLGYDEVIATVAGHRRLAVTLYWQRPDGATELSLQLAAAAGGKRLHAAAIATCQGTRPMAQWPVSEVVVETVVLELGEAAIFDLGIYRANGELLLTLPR